MKIVYQAIIIQLRMKSEGNIKVFCRFRPFNSAELANNPTVLHRIAKGTQLTIKDAKGEVIFLYDHVFDLNSTQQEVFERVGDPVLNNIIDGFHGTIMAYGQTSSGKTHTMQGYEASDAGRGIMPRMIERLFVAIEKSPENIEFKLKISIFQLYCEKIRDLLDVSKSDLQVRESKQQGYYIENLTERFVYERRELRELIAQGQRNRITCATKMNEHSSRSHLIFQLTLSQTLLPDGPSKTSRLFLIDLAGSEKISKTGAEGKVLEQAKKINLSLTNLGTVIKALSQRKGHGHVPYRNSKLTKLLRESLGGNSKTTLIVTCSPHQMHLAETISTLRFGENAQKVKNKPKINRELTLEQLIKIKDKLEGDIAQRENWIRCLENYIKVTLKADLPPKSKVKEEEQRKQEVEPEQPIPEDSPQQQKQQTTIDNASQLREIQQQLKASNEQAQQRIKLLQQELERSQSQLKGEMDKYYHLKKQYHDLRDHLTSILSENITLKEQLEDKQRSLLLTDKSLHNNAYLIKMIYGEVLAPLDAEHRNRIEDAVRASHWYQRAIVEGASCTEYWHAEKEKLNRELQAAATESQSFESQAEESRRREESRSQKDNEKILQLERKVGLIFDQYHAMMALQTHWKAECQLYERNLRKKDEEIARLQKELDRMEQGIEGMNAYDYDDAVSMKSRLVKPLRGGLFNR